MKMSNAGRLHAFRYSAIVVFGVTAASLAGCVPYDVNGQLNTAQVTGAMVGKKFIPVSSFSAAQLARATQSDANCKAASKHAPLPPTNVYRDTSIGSAVGYAATGGYGNGELNDWYNTSSILQGAARGTQEDNAAVAMTSNKVLGDYQTCMRQSGYVTTGT